MNQEPHQTNESSLDDSPESNSDPSQHNQQASTQQATTDDSAQEKHQGTGFWSIVQSVLGAMFGVQSEQQREKDFDKGNAIHFIVGGLIFVLVFIFTILYFVNSALEGAGAS